MQSRLDWFTIGTNEMRRRTWSDPRAAEIDDWVCKEHPDRPWSGVDACGCGSSGVPCPACNPLAADDVESSSARDSPDGLIKHSLKQPCNSPQMDRDPPREWLMPALRRGYARLASWMVRDNRTLEAGRSREPTRTEVPTRMPESSRRSEPPRP